MLKSVGLGLCVTLCVVYLYATPQKIKIQNTSINASNISLVKGLEIKIGKLN